MELMAASGQIESQALAVVGQKFGSLAFISLTLDARYKEHVNLKLVKF